MSQLTDKIALITGSSRGIGAAIAFDLAAAGADVVVNYCRNERAALGVRDRIERLGRRAMVVQADVRNKVDIDRMFDRAESDWGKIHILVNSAGLEIRGATRDFDEAAYDATLDTNLKGAFFCARRALEGMKENGWGRVINISSTHERTPTRFSAPYAMSKGGLLLMMREIAAEYSRYGITVNNVAPGAIRTDINREVLSDPAYEAKVVARIPAGFIGQPEDISKTVVFLCTDDARYITGASIFVDGGLSL